MGDFHDFGLFQRLLKAIKLLKICAGAYLCAAGGGILLIAKICTEYLYGDASKTGLSRPAGLVGARMLFACC